MHHAEIGKLLEDIEVQVLAGASSFGLLGRSSATLALVDWFGRFAPGVELTIFGDREGLGWANAQVEDLARLVEIKPTVVVIAEDAGKEDLLRAALPYLEYAPRLIVSGYQHLTFRDATFEALVDGLLVPSIANGYPNSLIHLYQCLENASRLGLQGAVAEFGVFKGGTTMFLARAVRGLGRFWPVIGFDSFTGFPPRRSALDMYDHPGAEFHDYESVARYLSPENVELVSGDIVLTAPRLQTEDLVLSFIDTDNFSSAAAAIEVVAERTLVGGAIVFDHYAGVDRFRYTLGERMAAQSLLADSRYFNLHSTGVFLRQK